jgi:CTP synthase (UTP-ammonia lyase)
MAAMDEIRLAVVGDHNPEYETHRAIDHTLTLMPPGVEAAWHGTDLPLAVDAVDALWVAPGSPYRDDDAVYRTIEAARRAGKPILGTCGGCQYMLVEFARNAAGLDDAAHGEVDPDATEPLVASLACSLVGQRREIRPVAGTRLAALTGDAPFSGFHYCSYGLNDRYREALVAAGLVIGAYADDAGVEAVELPGHPFYMATLFQPQMESLTTGVLHPILGALIAAARGARHGVPTT